jgi:predicted ATPase
VDPSELKARAERILTILQSQSRRPYVIELTGTPKSGKTTSLGILQGFFKASGYRVQLQKERAGDCPLPMKAHFFFNAWTTTTMVAEVIAGVETNADVILLDRAFFDALIWLELQFRSGQVSEEENRAFSDFVLLERWRSLVDVTVLMTASPTKALQRENINAIVPRIGSVMNDAFLQEFNDVLKDVRDRYASKFNFIEIDSTEGEIVQVNADLAERLLERIEDWADPPIAVVDRSQVAELFGSRTLVSGDELPEAWARLEKLAKPMKRSAAERNQDVVQIVVCGVCANGSAALVLKRSANDIKTESYGAYTLWKGCHLEMRDGSELNFDSAAGSLRRRLDTDLHLKQLGTLRPLALMWDSTQHESQHVGFALAIPIENEAVLKSLGKKEFRRGARGYSLVGQLAPFESLFADKENFEHWSRKLVEERLVP